MGDSKWYSMPDSTWLSMPRLLTQGQPIIYVSDIAVRGGSALAGGKLVQGLLELYRRHYIRGDMPIPIYAELREKTSYPLVLKHIESFARKLDAELQIKEFESYREGPDIMHPMLIRVTPHISSAPVS